MKRDLRRRWLVPAALMAAAASAALDPSEFAVGWPLELPAEDVFFDVPLTLDVYRHSSSLNDLAILDAAGEPMPFYRVTAPPAAAGEQRFVLEASPLYAVAGGPDARVEISAGGGETRVSVAPPAEGASAEIAAFALDARAVERAPFAIELEWRREAQPFLLGVRIEQSPNLTDWRTVGSASVASLTVGSAEVRHARLPVTAAAGGYYRITPDRTVPGFHVQRATLIAAESRPPLLQRVQIGALADEPGAVAGPAAPLYFDAGGPVPARTAALAFANDRGWARADVAVSDSLEGPWTTIGYDVLFYKLDHDGETLASAPLAVGRHEARYWRVTPEQPLALARVTLELEYPEEYLRFSADGEAPYLLAAGTVTHTAGPDPTFAAVWSQRGLAAAAVRRATLGARLDLGGSGALEAPFPWRTAGLWAVLLGGALAVAWMAVRLAREMANKAA